jgi:hypothetical protein
VLLCLLVLVELLALEEEWCEDEVDLATDAGAA